VHNGPQQRGKLSRHLLGQQLGRKGNYPLCLLERQALSIGIGIVRFFARQQLAPVEVSNRDFLANVVRIIVVPIRRAFCPAPSARVRPRLLDIYWTTPLRFLNKCLISLALPRGIEPLFSP
jgi:hypothetical protein